MEQKHKTFSQWDTHWNANHTIHQGSPTHMKQSALLTVVEPLKHDMSIKIKHIYNIFMVRGGSQIGTQLNTDSVTVWVWPGVQINTFYLGNYRLTIVNL